MPTIILQQLHNTIIRGKRNSPAEMELSAHITAWHFYHVFSHFECAFQLSHLSSILLHFSHPPPWSEVKIYPLRVSLFPFHSYDLCLHTFLTSFAKFLQRCPAACWLASGNNNKSWRIFIIQSSCFWDDLSAFFQENGESHPTPFFFSEWLQSEMLMGKDNNLEKKSSTLCHHSAHDLKFYFNICEHCFFPFGEEKLWKPGILIFTPLSSFSAHSLHTAVHSLFASHKCK